MNNKYLIPLLRIIASINDQYNAGAIVTTDSTEGIVRTNAGIAQTKEEQLHIHIPATKEHTETTIKIAPISPDNLLMIIRHLEIKYK